MNPKHKPFRPRPWRIALPVAGVLALVTSVPALAHVEFVSSEPEAGVVLDASPASVTVTFSGELDATKSSFSLVGPAGVVGKGAVDPAEAARMVLVTEGLGPGDYEIQWTAASPDGHLERGKIPFSIAAPTPAPPSPTPSVTQVPATATPAPSTAAATTAAPTAAASPSTTPGSVDGSPAAGGGDVLLPILAALVLVAGVGAFVARRSRRA